MSKLHYQISSKGVTNFYTKPKNDKNLYYVCDKDIINRKGFNDHTMQWIKNNNLGDGGRTVNMDEFVELLHLTDKKQIGEEGEIL